MMSKQHSFTRVILPVLLGVWMDVSSGQSIQLIPQYPLIQGSVTLRLPVITGKIQNINWFKGPNTANTNQILNYFPAGELTVKGPLYHDGLSVSSDGSLMISNLNKADEGNYTAKIQTDKLADIFVYLKIYENVEKPTITASSSLPMENDAVTLTCNSTNAERTVWSRVPTGASVSSDNRTITFSRINRTNSGNYQCESINLASTRTSDPYTLTVAYGPENMTLTHSLENSTMSLTCSADSVPPPSYQWYNGTYLSAQQNTFHVTVTKLDNEKMYTCVVRNPVTQHTATASILLYISESTALMDCQTMDGCGSGLGVVEIAAIVTGIVLGIIILEVIVYFVLKGGRRKTPSSSVFEDTHVAKHNYEMTLPGAQKKTRRESNFEHLKHEDASIYANVDFGK